MSREVSHIETQGIIVMTEKEREREKLEFVKSVFLVSTSRQVNLA